METGGLLLKRLGFWLGAERGSGGDYKARVQNRKLNSRLNAGESRAATTAVDFNYLKLCSGLPKIRLKHHLSTRIQGVLQ